MTDEEVAAAKKNMLADVYTMLEAPLNQIENMGSQVINSFFCWTSIVMHDNVKFRF